MKLFNIFKKKNDPAIVDNKIAKDKVKLNEHIQNILSKEDTDKVREDFSL